MADINDGTAKWRVRDKRVADDAADNSTKIVTTSWLRSNIQSLVSGCIAAVATAAGFAYNLNNAGYIKFPSWLSGLIIQWGATSQINSGASATITLPIAFPTVGFGCFVSWLQSASGTGTYVIGANTSSKTTVTIYNWSPTGPASVYFLVLGK